MNRLLVITLFIAAVLAAPAPLGAQTIKLGSLAPKGSPWHDVIQNMAVAWREVSDGGITVRIYAGGAIGDEQDMVRKMRIGQLHGAVLTGLGLAAIVPEIRALQLPMMFRDDAELDHVRNVLLPVYESLFEARGFKVLNWGDVGWVRLFTAAPVSLPQDLQPMKLFVWAGDPALADAWSAQGFTPVPLALTDLFMGLQSGLVDAFFAAPIAALSFQWFGLAPNMTDIRVLKLIGATVITIEAWRAIPEVQRPILLQAARQAGEQSKQRIRAFEDEAIAVMQQFGLKVHALSPDQRVIWEDGLRSSWPVFVRSETISEIVSRAETLRTEYRERKGG